jgi:amino acid adenylation domain-containing protein
VVAAEYLFDQGHGEAPLAGGSPANKAYVIFTSGSTGIPKGVMIEHRGMLNHLYAKISDLGLTRDDVVAQNASQCFDISVWQLLAPLLVGARVEIFDDRLTNDVLRFFEEVECRGVTVLEVVPSFLRVMLNEIERPHALVHRLTRLRWLLSTGEALPVELCRQWLEMYPRIPMVNAFGPTECSDDVCHYFARYPPSADVLRVPIGKPIAGTQLYVLDRYMNPVPACIPGELYAGGRGVGRGYAGDPASTAEVFLPDPFSAIPGSRLYKTGDLVRLLADGEIEFLGRIDEQVKVRGFRIELGEIENALEQHADVSAGAAIVYERSGGDKRIVAYVVPRRDGAQLTEELRRLLQERLPDYMIPAAIFALDELPLTTTGKINRKALAAMAEGALASADRPFVPPSTPSEVTLADLCAEVLGLDRLSIQDDFFELGGHSLLAAQLISRVRELFKMDLPLKLLFEATTVEKLARAIDSLQAEREAQSRQIALALELVEGMTEDEAMELLKERDSISMKG